jgi:hypothetical protein
MIIFAIFMVIVAMTGGKYLIDLSYRSTYDSAAGYAVAAVLWSAACLGIAATAVFR